MKLQLSEKIHKYLKNSVSAAVHFDFSRHTNSYQCHLLISTGLPKGICPTSSADSKDIHYSFDLALAKLEHQLRKYKEKLKNHKIKESDHKAIKYVITSDVEDTGDWGESPAIIAEKSIDILTLSVKEAVMKMDLENLPALMFQNSKNGKISMVYYRNDGNIAWVDSNKSVA